ncbi:MAG: hypothetical protein ACREJM_00340, partial [Candidatus Saccharimonadales bacterium]
SGPLTSRYVFHSLSASDNASRLSVASEQLDHLTVLALVAVFGRVLRDYVASVIQRRFSPIGSVETRISMCLLEDAEFWNFSARLIDVFDNVQVDVRGQVKQFVDFRNWFAHGRHAAAAPEPPPINVIPKNAHQVLTTFLRQAGLI